MNSVYLLHLLLSVDFIKTVLETGLKSYKNALKYCNRRNNNSVKMSDQM
jgi:hypothetical protein